MIPMKLLSRGFLMSLTGSLLLHLLILLVILVPSSNHSEENNSSPAQPSNPQEFTSSLLINYSENQLQKSLAALSPLIQKIPDDRQNWRKETFVDSFKKVMEDAEVDFHSLTILQGQLSENVYTIKAMVKTGNQKVLSDCIFLSYLAGVATRKSNFRTDNVHLVCSNDDGAIINIKVSTLDCRLFATRKLSAKELLQRLELF